VSGWLFMAAAGILSVERLFYVFVARSPGAFQLISRHPVLSALGTPVEIVEAAFYVFKAIQFSVFGVWCLAHGPGSWRPFGDPAALIFGCVFLLCGQVLNLAVFYRLGRVGVFYGDRLGHAVPMCRSFPYSLLDHPQYFGAVLSIWGFFLMMRFPEPDWSALPILETLYYAVGSHAER
jgi:methylene-fatty-acyl-phospholipid synthase